MQVLHAARVALRIVGIIMVADDPEFHRVLEPKGVTSITAQIKMSSVPRMD